MKRQAALFVLLIIGLIAGISFAATGPVISIGDRHLDLGEVARGDMVKVEFAVENVGDEPLEITVKPTCGCTAVTHDDVVEPGSRSTIVAQIDTAELEGPTKKSLLVASNDRSSPVLTLTVQADVR